LNVKVKIWGVALLFVTLGSEALTLGRVRGAAWVGKPLDMTVAVQLDASEDAAALCFEADVFHADTRQEASRVRVLLEPTAQAQSVNVRVQSSALVDEPVVTVYLRTGCGQKTTRRYVLLADMPSETAAPPAAGSPAIARAVPAPVAAPMRVEPPLPTDGVPAVKTRTVRAPKSPVTQAVVATAPQTQPPDKKKKPVRADGQSRLKLDSMEWLSDRVANLDASMTFEPPEDALRNKQRMQTLEDAVKTGQLLAAKNEASLSDLKARLQQAEAARFPVGVLYGLIVLVLASLAAVVFLWMRQRRLAVSGQDWWSGTLAAPDQDAVQAPEESAPEPAPAPVPVAAPTPVAPSQALYTALAPGKSLPPPPLTVFPSISGALSGGDMDVQLMDMSESTFGDFLIKDASPSAAPAPVSAAAATPTRRVASFNSEAMLDLRQQAEFFVSLGETDRAIRILKREIDESAEANPFFYLDLLEILHSLNLKQDFQQWREKFQQVFSGRVPEFAGFKDEGRDLESYPEVLSRLTAQWSTPSVLEEIDACIFQSPEVGLGQTFDLAAFRELLLLHATAQSLLSAPATQGSEPRLEAAARAPLHRIDMAPADPLPTRPPVTPAPFVLDLDLDLSDENLDAAAPSLASGLDFELPDATDDSVPAKAQSFPEHGELLDFELPKASSMMRQDSAR
jgi:pilus assembly protein FimV